MASLQNLIASAPLFNGLPSDNLADIAGIAQHQHFSKGQLIFSESDDANGFYIVVAGQVKIFKLSPEGKEQILHMFGEGEPFGEVPVFAGSQFPANAQATAKSHLLFFPREKMVQLIKDNPSLALRMLGVLSRRLREFTVQIENLALKEVPGRLATYLIYLAQEQETPSMVILTISKGQLASLLGTIPETLSRIFAKMSEHKLIEVSGKEIRICDPPRLAALAESGKFEF